MALNDFIGERLEAAIASLGQAIARGRSTVVPLEDFLSATGELPLDGLGRSERAVSLEISLCDVPRYDGRRPFQGRSVVPWFDIFSLDGFRREAALRAMSGAAPNPFLLAMLLRRLNDWVPQVREAARAAVVRVASATELRIVSLVLMSTLPTLASWGRLGDVDSETLDSLVAVRGVADALFENIVQSTAGPAPEVLRQAVRTPAMDIYLPRLAREARQPMIRALSYEMLLAGRARWVSGWRWEWVDKTMGRRVRRPAQAERPLTIDRSERQVLVAAASDRSAFVRRVAADFLIANRPRLGPDDFMLAARLAEDGNAAVADRARFVLERR